MATFGKVKGTFQTMIVDSADPDSLPQVVKLHGFIDFLVNASRIIDNTDPANPVVFGASLITAIVPESTGLVSTPDALGTSAMYTDLWVPATDDPNMNPHVNVVYNVTYRLKDPLGKDVKIDPHPLAVPAGSTVDLGNFIAPSGAPVQSVAQAQASAALAIAAANSAVKTINGVGPDSAGDVTVAGGSGGASTVEGITNATTLGKTMMKLADPAAGRTALAAAASVDLDNVFTIANAAIPLTQKATANGVATLDSGGLIPAAQIPAIAITEYLGSSANQAAMLAKTGQKGDWTTRVDLATTWIITGTDPTQLASWTQIITPVSPITTVFGRTGAITASTTDISEGANLYYTDSRADARVTSALTAAKGANNGIATLGATGKVPSAQMPGYVGAALATSTDLLTAQQALGIYQIAAGAAYPTGAPVNSIILELA